MSINFSLKKSIYFIIGAVRQAQV